MYRVWLRWVARPEFARAECLSCQSQPSLFRAKESPLKKLQLNEESKCMDSLNWNFVAGQQPKLFWEQWRDYGGKVWLNHGNVSGQQLFQNVCLLSCFQRFTNALCGYLLVKMELEIQAKFSPQHPFSCCLIISDRNICRLSAAQFHFLNNIWVRVEHSLLQQLNLQKVNCSSSSLQAGCE